MSLTLTAANDDVLHGSHTSVEYLSETLFTEVLVFDLGTGRFVNATGELIETIEITFETESSGTYTLRAEGTITY